MVAQALQYLRKLCSHPLLVLDPTVPEHVAAVHAEVGAGDWASAQVGPKIRLPSSLTPSSYPSTPSDAP